MPGSVNFVSRLVQTFLILIITFSLLKGIHTSRSTGESIASHYAKKYSSRNQGIFSLRLFNSSRGFGYGEEERGEEEKEKPVINEAKRISPQELMHRSLPFDRTRAPKLLHQSWKNDTLPAKFQRWSATCQKANPDWEYVLWSDKDNLELITRFAPWFLKTYKDLKSEIYRADAIRNVYMHVFGGCVKVFAVKANILISTSPESMPT